MVNQLHDTSGTEAPLSQPQTTALETALAYASCGWYVFPADLSGGNKKSHKSKEHSDGRNWGKTIDPDEIQRDRARCPDAGIGIATGAESGIFVIEADTPEGHDVDGIASLKALEEKHGPLPETLMAVSPSGSVHYYFNYPKGASIKNSASNIAPGVDVRGEGGMVIAPPSVRKDGQYRWLNDVFPLADAPRWLIDLTTAHKVRDNVIKFPPPSEELLKRMAEDTGKGFSTDPADLPQKATVEEIKAALAVIPANCSEDEWWRIAAALYDHFGDTEDGFNIFHEWSATGGASYKGERDCRNKWRHSASKKDIHIGTLFHYADEYDASWRDGLESPARAQDGICTEGTNQAGPESDEADTEAKDEGPSISSKLPPLTVSEWLECDMQPLDKLLGDLLTTTSRAMIVGPTGLGKTMFGLAISFRIPQGKDFMHWKVIRSGRVLYVDGEMSNRQMKRRIQAELKRSGGVVPEGLFILNKEFFPDMPALNTKMGQMWLDKFIIKGHGPFDLIIFDNIQSLLVGNVKDNEQWADTMPYVRDLTRRGIGQIWFHHTGFDESHSYGDKSREWQLDTVVMMERVKTQDDLAFRLTFPKARERCPENKADFADVVLALRDDEWVHGPVVVAEKPLGQNQRVILRMLQEAEPDGLSEDAWREMAKEKGGINRQRFYDASRTLKDRGLVCERDGHWGIAM
jgi:Bifunctional DNA primase/polymerase, N-terminal/AAA domain/Primase C terminal 2 (PriCT-2)